MLNTIYIIILNYILTYTVWTDIILYYIYMIGPKWQRYLMHGRLVSMPQIFLRSEVGDLLGWTPPKKWRFCRLRPAGRRVDLLRTSSWSMDKNMESSFAENKPSCRLCCCRRRSVPEEVLWISVSCRMQWQHQRNQRIFLEGISYQKKNDVFEDVGMDQNLQYHIFSHW